MIKTMRNKLFFIGLFLIIIPSSYANEPMNKENVLKNPWTRESIKSALKVGLTTFFIVKGSDTFGDPIDEITEWEVTEITKDGFRFSADFYQNNEARIPKVKASAGN